MTSTAVGDAPGAIGYKGRESGRAGATASPVDGRLTMCCFSRPVEDVSDTVIFARPSTEGRQYLVYSMKFKAREDLAMILPIPVPKGAGERAVRFINLEKYPEFFADMEKGFPQPRAKSAPSLGLAPAKGRALEVVEVGSFVASFVPSVRDFTRLDERFRLPESTWAKLPAYKDFGFAVFQLKKGHSKVHPMAFEFPRANPKPLFFPTVHIHDGTVKPKAHFDHTLYCQGAGALALLRWTESSQPARMFLKVKETQGLVAPDQHCYKRRLTGLLTNEDTLV